MSNFIMVLIVTGSMGLMGLERCFAWQISSGNLAMAAAAAGNNQQMAQLQNQNAANLLSRYFSEKNLTLSSSEKLAVQAYPAILRQMMFREMSARESTESKGSCRSSLAVTFPGLVLKARIKRLTEFEAEMLKLDSVDCLGRVSLEKALQTFLNDSFQMKSISGLVKSQSDELTNRVCQQTSVSGVGHSSYCYVNQIWKDQTGYLVFSFVDSSDPTFSAPVYLRAVLTYFRLSKSGEVQMLNLSFGRGPDLPFHFLVKGIVAGQRRDFVEALKKAIN